MGMGGGPEKSQGAGPGAKRSYQLDLGHQLLYNKGEKGLPHLAIEHNPIRKECFGLEFNKC